MSTDELAHNVPNFIGFLVFNELKKLFAIRIAFFLRNH